MRMKDPVEGTAMVNNAGRFQKGSMYDTLKMWLTVEAPGVEPFQLEKKFGMHRTKKWPTVGQVLPVVFDRENPDRIEVHWDQVPRRRMYRDDLREVVDFMHAPHGETTQVFGPDSAEAQQALGMVSQMLGGAMLTPPAPPAAPAPPGGSSMLDQLEKLGKLRDSGVLTDEEFEAQKRRLLGP